MMYLLVLATYKKSHGDADPPFCLKVKEANGQEVQLGEWCDRMRTEYSKQTLATAKIAKLSAKGFRWEPKSTLGHSVRIQTVAFNFTL